ncbi:Hypothetical predicted protein [Octopus vulgaris]|uniref:MD-2-related lipid-recognition domain-containing protein n=1 Tax=Octopus vulgaris TaxID=6645 RepID=A0AA36F8W7_OCTVU|nr:Hypothetical predicted protein [Octopus vulgaris]
MTMASGRMFWSLLLVMSTLAFAKGSLVFEDCGSNQATIDSVSVSNCTKLPCQIKRGSQMHLNVSFTPKVSINSAKVKVYGIVHGINIPFPVSPEDACKNSGLHCPLSPGTTANYHYSLDISNDFPEISVIIKWLILQGKVDVFCFEISALLI